MAYLISVRSPVVKFDFRSPPISNFTQPEGLKFSKLHFKEVRSLERLVPSSKNRHNSAESAALEYEKSDETETAIDSDNPENNESEPRNQIHWISQVNGVLQRVWSEICTFLEAKLSKPLSFVVKYRRTIIFLLTVSLALTMWLKFSFKPPELLKPESLPYSEFISFVKGNKVSEVGVLPGSKQLLLKLTNLNHNEYLTRRLQTLANSGAKLSPLKSQLLQQLLSTPSLPIESHLIQKLLPSWHYVCQRVPRDEAFVLALLAESGVKFGALTYDFSARMLSVGRDCLLLLPLVLIMALYFKSMVKSYGRGNWKRQFSVSTTFDDVAGVDSAKEELLEVVKFLRAEEAYKRVGARLPRGILLVGPPGTGKTLLARAVAGEAGVPFISASASEFVEVFVGRGAARVRALFTEARRCQPCIVFIDELDAIGGARGSSMNDERDQTLNQLLTELDGFDSSPEGAAQVLVLAATNRAETLDAALVRPGRVSRRIHVGLPSEDGRRQILLVHLRGRSLEGSPAAMAIVAAKQTDRFSGAGLAEAVNNAALLAARRGSEKISLDDLLAAVQRCKADMAAVGSVAESPLSTLLEMQTKLMGS